MSIVNFAHNGVHHATDVEAIAHDGTDNTMWILLGSVVMAAILYMVTRTLSRRQPQEQDSQDEPR